MTDFYADLNLVTSGGAGTEADPWNGLELETTLEAMTGDQAGDTYFVKRGGTYASEILINSAFSFRIWAYGTGARPVFDAGLVNDYGITIENAQDVILRGLHGTQAKIAGIAFWARTGVTNDIEIYDCEGSYATGSVPAGDARDGISIECGNVVGTGTGIKFRGNYLHDNENNGLEISQVDGGQFSDNTYENCINNAIEFWDANINCVVERDISIECGRFVWFAPVITDHTNNTVKNCVGIRSINHFITIQAGPGTTVYNCAGTTKKGNTSSGHTIFVIENSPNCTIRNCIGVLRPSTNTTQDFLIKTDTASVATLNTDNNIYRSELDDGTLTIPRYRSVPDAQHQSLASWNSTYGLDTNSVEQVDPLFVSEDNNDLSLQSGSPALFETATEAAGVVVDDFNRDTRYGGIDLGAYQYQRHPTISTGLQL